MQLSVTQFYILQKDFKQYIIDTDQYHTYTVILDVDKLLELQENNMDRNELETLRGIEFDYRDAVKSLFNSLVRYMYKTDYQMPAIKFHVFKKTFKEYVDSDFDATAVTARLNVDKLLEFLGE